MSDEKQFDPIDDLASEVGYLRGAVHTIGRVLLWCHTMLILILAGVIALLFQGVVWLQLAVLVAGVVIAGCFYYVLDRFAL